MSKNAKIWVKAAGVRAAKTMAQTAVAMVPVGACINEVTWPWVVGTALVAGICSVLTSIAGLPEVDEAEELAASSGK